MLKLSSEAKCVEQLILGNVTIATKQAKRFGNRKLRVAGQDELGLSLAKATAAADFLKGELSWQTYCDTN
jgi:hypothetical protein